MALASIKNYKEAAMDNLNKIIAENITFLRTTNKMTQLELAERLNYSDKAVSKWERGDSIPDVRVLLNIANIFGVKINYLLEDHGIEELPLIPEKKKVNFKVVTTIALVGVWTAALLFFLIWNICTEQQFYHVFIVAVPVSLIVLLIFTSIWSKKRRFYNFFIISALCWSILLTLWSFMPQLLSFLWLGIPAQVIVLLVFKIYQKKR